jgi:deoxyribodipyrimidine photo-lyase
MPRLVWFRNDLRTLENPALDAAAMSTEASVLGVCFLSPTQWKLHGWGTPRVSFMLEHLRLVRRELEHMGIPLLIQTVESYSDIPTAILDLMKIHGCTKLDANIEYGLDEQRRDAAVLHTLRSSNMELTLHEDQTIIPCNDFRTGGKNPYRVYTPFRKKWEQLFAEQPLPARAPKSPKRRLSLESGSIPNTIAGFEPWPQQTMWTPGTDAALHRLSSFLDGPVDMYHRNRDRPDLEGTSSLSPWLAVGAISPMSCMRPLVARHGPDPRTWPEGPRTWQSELVWRDFYRHVMWNYPAVSMHKPMKSWTENVAWQHNKGHFAAWCEGRTGVDFVDAAMRQLQATGWMHNRMRMITAMFLTKNLLIDWRRGEEFFAQHLIDYDFASNNGGWQWAASTGTDAAPYFRIFNPERQAEIFDPDGTYRTRWLIDRPPCEAIVDLKASRANAIATFKQARELPCL